MNQVDLLIRQIKKTIKYSKHPCYENTAGTWIYCRCPKCGDSHDPSKAHFYIEMKPPFRCYCQKCSFSAPRLTTELLGELNIYNNDLIMNINEANKLYKVTGKLQTYEKKEASINYDNTSDQHSKLALEYFNKRYNTNLTEDEVYTKFKCILNPLKLLKTMTPVSTNMQFDYSKAIGFLSTDNKYMICRDITNTQKLRYSNVSLSKDDDKSKCYNIKTKVDILEDKITLVITEGIFDAIGIYLKEYKDKDNVIVAAGCGKSFNNVINDYIKMGFLNLDIIIYSDSDVDIKFYKDLKRNNIFIKNTPIVIYYNTLEKDCGVPADRIQLKRMVI